jgi:hypothetical protein
VTSCGLDDGGSVPEKDKSFMFWNLMPSVALVITDVSEERIASIIRLTRIAELGATLTVN